MPLLQKYRSPQKNIYNVFINNSTKEIIMQDIPSILNEDNKDIFDKEQTSIEQKTKESMDVIREMYLNDDRVFSVGFSAGKDSTVALDHVLKVLKSLPPEKRTKTVYVLLSETGEDLEPMQRYVDQTIKGLRDYVTKEQLPVSVHVAKPKITDTYWVNIIGRGMQLPSNNGSSWCVERMKTKPSTQILKDTIFKQQQELAESLGEKFAGGKFISVTGSRSDESVARAKRLKNNTINGFIKENKLYPGSAVLATLEDWSTEDIWQYIGKYALNWFDKDEITMLYASTNGKGGECSTILDEQGGTKPGCAASGGRFGCWACTKMKTDKAQIAMAQFYPYLEHRIEFRTWLTEFADTGWENTRDVFRHGTHTFRPYNYKNKRYGMGGVGGLTMDFRIDILHKILKAEYHEKETKPDSIIVSDEELHIIAELWLSYGDIGLTSYDIVRQYGRDIEIPDHLIKKAALAKLIGDFVEDMGMSGSLKFRYEISTSPRFWAQFILSECNGYDLSNAEKMLAEIIDWTLANPELKHNSRHHDNPLYRYIEKNGLHKQFHPSKEEIEFIQREWEKDEIFISTKLNLAERGLLLHGVPEHEGYKKEMSNMIDMNNYDPLEDPSLSIDEKFALLEDDRRVARQEQREEYGIDYHEPLNTAEALYNVETEKMRKEAAKAIKEAERRAKEAELKMKESQIESILDSEAKEITQERQTTIFDFLSNR